VSRRQTISVLEHQKGASVPTGRNVFYLCLRCRNIVPSLPPVPSSCECRNVSVDPDAGRGGARDPKMMIVLQITSL
jgi:hypothetical protein